jgi:hypothetical protein
LADYGRSFHQEACAAVETSHRPRRRALAGTLVARDATTGASLWTGSTVAHSTSGYTAVVVANSAVDGSRRSGVTVHHP